MFVILLFTKIHFIFSLYIGKGSNLVTKKFLGICGVGDDYYCRKINNK